MANNEEFDPLKAIEAMGAYYADKRRGPKLTFEGRCQVYAALHGGAPQVVVAKAFDLSPTTVSNIASCRDDDRIPVVVEVFDGQRIHSETHMSPHLKRKRDPDRRPRYPEVAAEFEGMGEEEFIRRYYTHYTEMRLKIAHREIYRDKIQTRD